MKASLSTLIFLFAGQSPAFSWTVPTSAATSLTQSRSISSLTTPFTRIYAQEQDDNDAVTQAQLLKERAEKARLEAQEMEKSFVEQKLQTLESLLEKQSKLSSSVSSSKKREIQEKIDRLKEYQNPKPKEVVVAIPETKAEEEDEEEQQQEKFVGELSEEDREAVQEIQSIFFELQDALNFTFEDPEVEEAFLELDQDLENALAGNITQEDLELFKGVMSFFNALPGKEGIKEAFFSTTRELAEEMTENKEMEKVDPYYRAKIMTLRTELIPEQMQMSSVKVNQTDIDEFVAKVMNCNQEVFKMNAKPRKLGRYYIIEGTPLVDGDTLVDKLGKQLTASGLEDKLQYFYIRDPSALVDMDEVQIADMVQSGSDEVGMELLKKLDTMEPRTLLVMPAEHKADPSTSVLDRVFLAALALSNTASFAGNCYVPDGNTLDQILAGLGSPILVGLFGLLLAHELGHFAAAALNKIELAIPPFLFPSPGTGLLPVHAQPKSPPENNKALFDFAISGPLLGMISSWGMLAYGLVQTALVKSNEIPALPHVPLDFLKLSCLTSATIESLIGTDVLLSLDTLSDNVAVHPLVIAGHVGILINALSLLPNSSTSDGGRMQRAVFTRTGILGKILPSLFIIFLWVQGIRDWSTSSLLIFYASVNPLIMNQRDVPCRNDVDPVGSFRLALFLASILAAVIAVSPAF